MHIDALEPEAVVSAAVDAWHTSGDALRRTLDARSSAVYTTDASGIVTYYNKACTRFAGRLPRPKHDVWCVTWKLYTEEGEFLPHDQCPMAMALLAKRAIRGVEAIAERPDGTYVKFRPHPTPVFNEAGTLVGAVNLLLDVSGSDRARELRSQAARHRRLINLMTGPINRRLLTVVAASYEQQARQIEEMQ